MTKNFDTFEDKIGYSFNDKSLLEQAFIHRSYLNEHRDVRLEHNERLEFLGDAVLELVVTDHLFHQYPKEPEGALTSYRAALVNATTLASIAVGLGMNEYLLLSKGEEKDVGRARHYLLANTFEALVGALYLDGGYDAARAFIEKNVFPLTAAIVEQRLWQDAKSKFQEEAQERDGVTPSYEMLKQAGPDHDKKFTVGVYIKGELIAEGEGKSKQEAEQDAAKAALLAKGW